MKHVEKIAIIKNIGSSWLGLVVNMATGLVVSPYILHKLGDEAFGLWALVFSISGYYGLFSMGIRSSVVRYVARFKALEDRDQLLRVINTSLFAYTCIGAVALLVTLILAWFLPRMIHLQASSVTTAKILFLMVGASVAIGFPLSVFAGILEGLQKFYLLNVVNIANTIVRAAMIIIALNHGYGLLAVAFITVALPFVSRLVNAANVFWLIRATVSVRFISMDTLKLLVNYGAVTFMITVAENLRFRTDELVIGGFLTAAAITPFAIGSRIVDYATSVVDGLAQVFTPMSSHFDARGEVEKLRSIFIAGNRGCALVMFPMCAGLIILGKSIIRLWMGARYIPLSYPVLLLLLIPCTMRMSQATTGRILFGMARHKTLAWVVLAEGVANLILSILLVRPYGIVGDALGTAIPLTCTCLLFLPQHMCRILEMRVPAFLKQAYTTPLLLCLPMVCFLLPMEHWFAPRTLAHLALHILLASTVYAGFVYYFMFLRGPLSLRRPRTQPPEQAVEVALAEEAGE